MDTREVFTVLVSAREEVLGEQTKGATRDRMCERLVMKTQRRPSRLGSAALTPDVIHTLSSIEQ